MGSPLSHLAPRLGPEAGESAEEVAAGGELAFCSPFALLGPQARPHGPEYGSQPGAVPLCQPQTLLGLSFPVPSPWY